MLAGFIPGSRGTFMMDVVVTAMVALVPLLTWSVYLAHGPRNFSTHKRLQQSMGLVLLLTVIAFEVEVRLSGWRQHAVTSPYYETSLFPLLYVHLFFAVGTFSLWILTLGLAMRKIPDPPAPSAHSQWHRRLGKLTVMGTYCTSVTGWTFYYMAFLA